MVGSCEMVGPARGRRRFGCVGQLAGRERRYGLGALCRGGFGLLAHEVCGRRLGRRQCAERDAPAQARAGKCRMDHVAIGRQPLDVLSELRVFARLDPQRDLALEEHLAERAALGLCAGSEVNLDPGPLACMPGRKERSANAVELVPDLRRK